MTYDYNVLYWIKDVFSCVAILIGIGGAVFLFLRKKIAPAILALIGFLAMGLEPILDIIIWRLLNQSATNPNYQAMDFAYVCISAPGFLLGIVLLVVAFVIGFRTPKPPPPAPVEDIQELPPSA
jgi:hypothetical protein